MTKSYDVAVIGNGMIGAAATRYLTQTGRTVAAIGPAEPTDWRTHDGVFASHYDQGRITRIIDPDAVWGLLGKRAIAAYPALEEASGIQFHGTAGCLRVSPDTGATGDTLHQAEAVGRQHDAVYTVEQSDEGLNEIFPFLNFPMGSTALWERGGAGYVNPRQLVQAQLTVAQQQGATLIRAVVSNIATDRGGAIITTATGETIHAAEVLISAGAYSSWLLPRPLIYQRKAVTVLLAELDEAEAARLRATPSIIYRLPNHPVLASIYSLPPLTYPDGRVYLKIGGTLHTPNLLTSADAIRQWFHGDGNDLEVAALQEVLLALVADLHPRSLQSRPCVVTYTSHGYPYIGQVADHLYVATGGCGAAAKSSNEIGKIGAQLVEQAGAWHYDLPAELFHIRYEEE
ncbi:MAG TPA: FAD-dependent oxidoreductase [Caldilineaceae bacterium]|nr:FAD-dependent oxidoreductase [Caldilineaceae bacterium]